MSATLNYKQLGYVVTHVQILVRKSQSKNSPGREEKKKSE